MCRDVDALFTGIEFETVLKSYILNGGIFTIQNTREEKAETPINIMCELEDSSHYLYMELDDQELVEPDG